jgi:hypothetical protein
LAAPATAGISGIFIHDCHALGSANWDIHVVANAWGSGMFISASIV